MSSRPYYLEAVPGFEIRVHSADIQRARGALAWIENKASTFDVSSGRLQDVQDRLDPTQSLPDEWDATQATSEVWAGEDESMAEYLASALRENGIPSRIPDEPGHRARLCVRLEDMRRAKEIARDIIEGKVQE